jgi:hypothetical protein
MPKQTPPLTAPTLQSSCSSEPAVLSRAAEGSTQCPRAGNSPAFTSLLAPAAPGRGRPFQALLSQGAKAKMRSHFLSAADPLQATVFPMIYGCYSVSAGDVSNRHVRLSTQNFGEAIVLMRQLVTMCEGQFFSELLWIPLTLEEMHQCLHLRTRGH